MPFRFPPTTVEQFRSFNDYAHLNEDEKFILPKHKKMQLLRAMKISEQDCILCVDIRANIVLQPCQHTGFCHICAEKLENCPICRTEIEDRKLIDE